MKVKLHNVNLTSLSKKLGTDQHDCAAWVEEFVNEVRESDGKEEATFDNLGDHLYPDQLDSICQSLIEHYNKENDLDISKVKGDVFFLKVT